MHFKIKTVLFLFSSLVVIQAKSQTITIIVDALKDQKTISPAIYGKNNSASQNSSKPVSHAQWQFIRDAGVRLSRENEGNNSTKYNWRKKLSSHPDWYNNVERHDWDYTAKEMLKNVPDIQQMWAIPLMGYVAKDSAFNFDCYAYDTCKGSNNELNKCANGDASKYLEPWSPDSAVGILNHWLKDLKLNPKNILYWNLDNEPELWAEKHDDIVKKEYSAEDYIQSYVATAKRARTIFPEIKLVGPAFSNEWGWYNWNKQKVKAKDGKSYTWIEYFIKRVAEEQKASGLKLLDVLDIHFYPETTDPNLTLQVHRIWYDTSWVYPKGNGIKRLGPADWNQSQEAKEFIFARCNNWLKQYMGENNGVTMGASEYGQISKDDPNVVACWYASHLGTFADNGVELFTPWDWYTGMWEVLHLFSKHAGSVSVASTSTSNDVVSAYSSLSSKGDSLVVIIVNKDQNNSQSISLALTNVLAQDGNATMYSLSDLPKNETFKSATNNALKQSTVAVKKNTVQLSLPKLSVTAIVIKAKKTVAINVK